MNYVNGEDFIANTIEDLRKMPFYYLNFVKLETSIIMIPNFKAHPWHGVSAGDDVQMW